MTPVTNAATARVLDKLGVYGLVGNQWRWLIDTDNDGDADYVDADSDDDGVEDAEDNCMNSLLSRAGLVLVFALSGIGACAQEIADTIYINGKIYTVNEVQPWAEAVAIKDGKFLVVGSKADAEAVTGDATEVGRLLEEHAYDHFEEPCPYWELEQTRQVSEALDIDVTGGEQDCDIPTWRRMIDMRAVDIVQPDICYLGGLSRTLRVCQMAEAASLPVG